MTRGLLLGLMGLVAFGAACTHATPQILQGALQVNHTFDPETGQWDDRLSVFVQASDADGAKVFDRLHLVHDDSELVVSLGTDTWTKVERAGEVWMGTNGLRFPEGVVPTGTWKALLVTRAGLRTSIDLVVPPKPVDRPPARTEPVTVTFGTPGQATVQGWVDDYVVWCWDANGNLLARNKTVGNLFTFPPGTTSVRLYSYDNATGEGLEAGPFPVK